MLAIQKPVALFSSPQAHLPRSTHSRHPSAPVVIRPTQTPGLLSLSKPAQQHLPRPQQSQPHVRASRTSTRGKQQRSPQPVPAQAQSAEDGKKAKASKPSSANPPNDSSKPNVPSLEKSTRGRRSAKVVPKEKADQRSPSASRAHARRQSHQPSPPPAKTPSESDPSRPSVNPLRAQSFERQSASNLFDPFVVNSTSDNESPEPAVSKDSAKPISFRPPPQLASRPNGKLAHRRQSGQVHDFPMSSQAIPVARTHGSRNSANLSRSTPNPTPVTPPRRAARRAAMELPLAQWGEFPICDDMTVSSPTTPVRESASCPSKRLGATWQQTLIDDAPRTAPLSSTYEYPFAQPAFVTPSPAARRRHHQRVPSDGVFAMSTDDDSSESSDELKNVLSRLALGGAAMVDARRTPSPSMMDGMPAGFYAGSVFQNSPSPEELPVPAFRP
ncbi:uncharacterized protein PHACADRAFT_251371 [Phanerochaete carnosa HHB-10118-sp]|uniref:Uncharacterized protein n=1 Tax=Phanerochaete carnosa (strain HHB-10118-sp) TaxID=650164 RepID=K5V4T0_PHACS|nr:uncharacterized protein PHACADRAFT_251371 [Phanerochaete carnosa HHB-10118-sp]EKM57636.1 hypothetical protein PHACADRAFT_251371 [Phanerochaete carnosa HHB-10118-sp]